MLRTCLLALLLAGASLTAAEPLDMDALHGTWVVDEKAATKEQAAAVAAAKAIEGFGVVLTTRTARVVFDADGMVAGIWRLDAATPTTAVLVIQPKGGEERRFNLTVTGDRMVVAEQPDGLPLIRKR
jgi:hypothetical protein